jgi:hypothetical protein
MTIPVTRETISYGGASGCILKGVARQVISGQGATRTLLPGESGALCLFDRAAGIVYTLPPLSTVDIGMQFEFLTTVTVTSNAAKTITSAATEFMVGGVSLVNNAATTGEAFSANGTTIRSLSSNGSTTGGVQGDRYRVTAISTTVWAVDGVLVQSGTAATPFATS